MIYVHVMHCLLIKGCVYIYVIHLWILVLITTSQLIICTFTQSADNNTLVPYTGLYNIEQS